MKAYYEVEEAALNSWPALQTRSLGGWLVKANQGSTKRSNSVQPLHHFGPTELDLEDKINRCEQFYRGNGQPAIFKITPFTEPDHLDEVLARRGYRIADPSLVMVAAIPAAAPAGVNELVLEEQPRSYWLQLLVEWTGMKPSEEKIFVSMFESSPLPRVFALLYAQGRPVALGVGVLDGDYLGLYDIVTAPDRRGRGYAAELIRGLFRWAASRGVRQSYLQVVSGNKPAEALYAKLGYHEAYPYWYRVQQD
jgi:GNAT superfamily N-acetyltransferase